MKKEVYIVAAKRTPVGGLLGSLSSLSATQLGALAIQAALQEAGLSGSDPDAVYMGNVLSANVGQAPARQAAIFAGIDVSKDATTLNKVCASGMKAVALAAQQIELDLEHLLVAGGMESMSNAPHYLEARRGNKLGNMTLIDGMTKDGLWDVYKNFHMGSAAELGVKKFGFTREALDQFALLSYQRAQAASDQGKLAREIVPVTIAQKGGDLKVTRDEDIDKVIPEKVSKLKPVFEADGHLTAANSSNLNDGAAALILASAEAVKKYQLKPLAKIIGYADAAQEPEWFTTAPALAIPKALKHAGLELSQIDFFEINEAYASVILSMERLLNLDLNKVNVYGGAVAIGHPIGASGARILTTLISVLKQEGGRYGLAAICNGGGAASAMVLEVV